MAGSDLFTGSLDLIILKALSWGPMHGLGVLRCLAPTDGGVTCVPGGGTCTATGDCCTGLMCNVAPGAPNCY